MIIIGEKLNSSIPSTLKGLNEKSETFVTELARRQACAGAHYLDLNTGMCENAGMGGGACASGRAGMRAHGGFHKSACTAPFV